MKKKLIVGNWKMNGSLQANAELLSALVQGMPAALTCGVGVAVPSLYLSQVQALVQGSSIALAAQDVSQHEKGAYTGEVSADMLKEFGVRYTLVGHSERRQYHGETDAVVAAKAQAALAKGITPIVCVGETLEEREAGKTEEVVKRQLAAATEHAARVPLLYGGSMNAANAAQLLAQPDIDGGLVGGASLKAADFLQIIAAAN